MPQTLPDHLRDLARRVAQHEMGHYVVARLMGFRTGDVSIELTGLMGGHQGRAALELPTATGSLDQVADYLRRRVIVLYAGGIAEALPAYGSPSKSVDVDKAIEIIRNPIHGAEQDHAKATELIHVLRNIAKHDTDAVDGRTVQAELDELDGQLFSRAVQLVEEHADAVLGLAGNLAARVTAIKSPAIITATELKRLPTMDRIIPMESLRIGDES